jgi:hypothetical protein
MASLLSSTKSLNYLENWVSCIPGLRKAFDRLNHHYGFGDSFIKYVSMLITGFHTRLTVNGQMSDFFDVKCGSKQSDPISGLLFILCIEPLACAIHTDKKSKPIQISTFLVKCINLHADDTVLWS